MKTSPPFSLCALIATAAPLIGSGCVTQMGQGSGANPVERSVAVDSEGAPIADPPRPGAPQLLRPLPDARVLLITPSGQCMFPFAAQLSGPSLSWAAPEAIPIALQGTVGPARPLIRVNEFQVCILYGTQRCTTDSVNTRRAQDAINLGGSPPADHVPVPFHDQNVPLKAWRIAPLALPPYLVKQGGNPAEYTFYPGAIADPQLFPDSFSGRTLEWQVRACGDYPTGGREHCYESARQPITFECGRP